MYTIIVLLVLALPVVIFFSRIAAERSRIVRARLNETKGKNGGNRPRRKFASVVVLGDIGRSPRIMYHAVSLVEMGLGVNLIGYSGTNPLSSVLDSPNMKLFYLPVPKKLNAPKSSGGGLHRVVSQMFYIAAGVIRVIAQVATALKILLLDVPSSDFILIQNPPAIPTFLIVHVVAFLHNSRLVVDWHNLGYSVLALSLSASQPSRADGRGRKSLSSVIVAGAKAYEALLGTWGVHAHFTVTRAMKIKLINDWGVRAPIHVLYDKPPEDFHRLPRDESREFLGSFDPGPPLNLFGTSLSPTAPLGSSHRPVLVVSSCSYTEDDDLSILLRALALYSQTASSTMPDLFVVITGKGPLKARWEARIKVGRWEDEDIPLPLLTEGDVVSVMEPAPNAYDKVRLHTAFLSQEDYPRLLGCADVGVCLHASTSGLDLPMKVVDLFGCGTPVCALAYECLDELVVDGKNGLVFRTADQLAAQFLDLFSSFPTDVRKLDAMREAIGAEFGPGNRWSTNWNNVAGQVFK